MLRITASHFRRSLAFLAWLIAGLWFIAEVPVWRQGEGFPYEAVVAFLLGLVTLIELRTEEAMRSVATISLNTSRQLRYRQNFIATVKMLKIQGVLQTALHETIPIVLRLDDCPQALARPLATWDGRLIVREIDSNQKIIDIFDNSGQSLLVLGAPGSGKTFTLLELCAALVERADDNDSYPVPVMLDLDTWANKQRPLDEWLIDEILRQYGQSRPITQAWLAQGSLCLLLDGLDEVREDVRAKCVQTINEFRAKYDAPLAIASRTVDYEALAERLNLSQALLIQPLEDKQVRQYLADPKLQLPAVYTAIQKDDTLRELTTTPLILNIIAVAYRGVTLEELLPLMEKSSQHHRAHIFNSYIQRVFERRPLNGRYPVAQALKWLRYLSSNLSQKGETQFFIEDIQPSWLSPRQRYEYETLISRWASFVLLGFLGAFLGSLIGRRPDRFTDLSIIPDRLVNYLIDLFNGGRWILGTILGAILGATLGWTIPYVDAKVGDIQPVEVWHWQNLRSHMKQVMLHTLTAIRNGGVIGVLIGGAVASLAPYIGSIWGEVLNPIGLLVGFLLGGGVMGVFYFRTDYIRVGQGGIVGTIAVFLKHNALARGLFGLLIGGLIFGMQGGMIGALIVGLLTLTNDEWPWVLLKSETANAIRNSRLYLTLIGGLVGGVYFGTVFGFLSGILSLLTEEDVEGFLRPIDRHLHIRPNQGFHSSAKFAFVHGFLGIGLGSLIVVFMSEVFEVALSFEGASSIVFLSGFLGFLYAGSPAIEHYLLRLFLQRRQLLPFRITDFMDAMQKRILVQQTGASYRFIHRTFQEHIATLTDQEIDLIAESVKVRG